MPRPRSDIPERIIEAARAHFLKHGVDGATLRAIARDAGTNVGMVYYYHPTKDELFLAVVEDVYGKLMDELVGVVASSQSVEERLRAVYERLGTMSSDEHEVLRIIVREALGSTERLGRLVDRFLRGHVPMVAALLAQGAQDGTLTTKQHPFVLATVLVVSGFFPQVVRERIPVKAVPFIGELPRDTELARQLADVVLYGIVKR